MALQHIKYFIKTNIFPDIAAFHNQILSWQRAALALVSAGSDLPSFAFPVGSAEAQETQQLLCTAKQSCQVPRAKAAFIGALHCSEYTFDSAVINKYKQINLL